MNAQLSNRILGAMAAVVAIACNKSSESARVTDSAAGTAATTATTAIADSGKKLSAGVPKTVDAVREIGAKDRHKAMIDANRATFVSAELVRNYSGPTPEQVLLLDYEGRELEIWVALKNADKLATTKADIRRFWNELRGFVVARNSAQAQHTDALVARIEKANTPAELGRLATPFLDEVDLLEKVFTNQ